MASITIRTIDEPLKTQLRVRAAHNGHSMEQEVRVILREALVQPPPVVVANLAEAITRRFAPLGGVNLPDPERTVLRDPPDFSA